jgi:hypothetical protein
MWMAILGEAKRRSCFPSTAADAPEREEQRFMSVQSNSITPFEVSAVLAVSSKAAESERLAERLRQVAGPESL